MPTTVFTLSDGKKERRAIIKDIQYHLTTYHVSHIDFEELVDNVPVSVKVPVNCIGVADCMGIKFGGFLRQVDPPCESEVFAEEHPYRVYRRCQRFGDSAVQTVERPRNAKRCKTTGEP